MNKKNERINDFLLAYAKILIIIFSITMVMSAMIIILSGGSDCYREPTREELIYKDSSVLIYDDLRTVNDTCMVVDDIEAIQKEFRNYKIITIVCIVGYLIVNPRTKTLLKKIKEWYDKNG